ncbi:hypothetical protein BHE74_00017649, partial [Ensete ventricosum]
MLCSKIDDFFLLIYSYSSGFVASILLLLILNCSMCVREKVLPNDIDLLNPPAELEKRRHKLKRLVQSPNSFFMVTPRRTSPNYGLQPLTNCGGLRELPDCSLPANRRACQAHRGLLFQAE